MEMTMGKTQIIIAGILFSVWQQSIFIDPD